MNIWLEVSFGFNFDLAQEAEKAAFNGDIKTIVNRQESYYSTISEGWRSRVWRYFLVHILKIESISSNGSRDTCIAKSLKISFGSDFVRLRAFGSKFWQFRFPVYNLQTKQTALDYLYPFLSFSVHNFAHGRTDGWTDIHFSKKFSFFFLIKNIYTCLYLSRLFFKFHPHSDQS